MYYFANHLHRKDKESFMMDYLRYRHLNVNEICRICLVTKNEMVIIKDSGIEKILACSSVKILGEDENHFVCGDCIDEINKWYNYIRQVLKSFEIGHWLIQHKVNKSLDKQSHSLSSEPNNIEKWDDEYIAICGTSNANVLIKDITIDTNYKENFQESTSNSSPEVTNTEIVKQCLIVPVQLDSVHNPKPFECEKCGKTFQRVQNLNDHLKRHYNSRDFACSICGKTFYKQFNVLEHMRIHTGERPFNCDLCTKTFTRSLLLRNHIKKVHTNDTKFTCDVCNKPFVDNYQLKIHMRTHTGEKPYQCPQCDKSFAIQGQLTSHIKYKHTKIKDFICNFCGRAFTARHSLADHFRTHTGEKKEPRHECSVCGKKCYTTTQLKIHIKSKHTGERAFPCLMCDKSFVTKSALDCHLKTHTGEKSYLCGQCGKSFTTNSTLKVHLRIHSGERRFECGVCNKNFIQSSTLGTHMKIHK